MSEPLKHRPQVIIWGDGEGKSFRSTADAIHDNVIDVEIAGVITTNPQARLLEQVKEVNAHYGYDIEKQLITRQQYLERGAQ